MSEEGERPGVVPDVVVANGLMREFAATGTAVLVATHDRVAVAVADRVVTKQDGRLAGPA